LVCEVVRISIMNCNVHNQVVFEYVHKHRPSISNCSVAYTYDEKIIQDLKNQIKNLEESLEDVIAESEDLVEYNKALQTIVGKLLKDENE